MKDRNNGFVWPKKNPVIKMLLIGFVLIMSAAALWGVQDKLDPDELPGLNEPDYRASIASDGVRLYRADELKYVVKLEDGVLLCSKEGVIIKYDGGGREQMRFYAPNRGVCAAGEGFALKVGDRMYFYDADGTNTGSAECADSAVQLGTPQKSVTVDGAEFSLKSGKNVDRLVRSENGRTKTLTRHLHTKKSPLEIISMILCASFLIMMIVFVIKNFDVFFENSWGAFGRK